MDLKKTNLVIVAAQLPADFEGDPQTFFRAMLERMEIKSPVGTSFFIISDTQPTSDSGPWFKNGTKLYVFDATQGTYIPLDISDSETKWITTSVSTPADPGDKDPKIWRRINSDGSRTIGLYFWSGHWLPANVSASGGSADRPADPVELEQFWDTDIKCLIHWERSQWRTVSGTPGDLKFVTTTLLSDALTQNPGWIYAGETENGLRGKTLAIATKDDVIVYTPDAGITARRATDKAGEETHVLASDEIQQHTHLIGALSALSSTTLARFFRVGTSDDFVVPETQPSNYVQTSFSSNAAKTGNMPDPIAGSEMITSKQLSLTDAATFTDAAKPHNNVQPTCWLWCLQKT